MKTIYRNLDHTLDLKLVEEAKQTGGGYFHTARNFCGMIQYDKKKKMWSELIRQHRVDQETIKCLDIMGCIKTANNRYGRS